MPPKSAKTTVTIVKDDASPPVKTEEDIVNTDMDMDMDDEDGDYEDDFEDEDPEGILTDLLTNSEGESIAQILSQVRDALDKHNKILFKIMQQMPTNPNK